MREEERSNSLEGERKDMAERKEGCDRIKQNQRK